MFGGAKSSIKPVSQQTRTERIAAAKPKLSAPLPSHLSSQSKPVRTMQESTRSSPANAQSIRSPATPDRLDVPSKRKAQRQKSPGEQKPNFGEESEDEDDARSRSSAGSDKRQKVESATLTIDTKRKLRSKRAFLQDDHDRDFPIIHAADVASPIRKSKVPDLQTEKVTVELKYPSASQRERYDLVYGKDKIDSIKEIYDIAKIVAEVYLTEEQQKPFTDENTGIIRKIQRAMNLLSRNRQNQDLRDGFKKAVDTYNDALEGLIKGGVLAKNLDNKHHLPLNMVHIILRQVYDRAVSPEVDLLKAYENGTDNVYGELLDSFVSKILGETKLKSDQVFVDLGSGVGNVVLQAALEIGCESWGCEMMKNAYTLADRQKDEFQARCRLWGVKPGRVRLERDDFLENNPIKDAIRRADVILVNNQAFTTELNEKLKLLFLDVKDGCQIVSLRPFIPQGHQITEWNLYDPINNFRDEEDSYYGNSVSWTDAGGKYYRTTKDERRLQRFIEKLAPKE